MKTASKLTAFILSITMAVTLFAGCKNSQAPAGQPQTTGQSTPEAKTAASATPAPKKNVKLKWFQNLDAKAAATMKSYDEVASWKVIQEKTGIDIEWQHPPAGQEKEQFNLMIASRDLPDVIYTNWFNVAGGPAKMLQDGMIIKINDLITSSAPNYKKVLDGSKEARKQTMLDDGTFYMFARLFPNPESMSYNGLQIRKDWLDKLGLKVPSTIDEWYNVLTAFKTKDPNGNGKADEIPFLSQKGGDFSTFSAAWGVRRGFYPDPATGKIKYGPIEPAYKDFMETMVKWYQEGLIDVEFASVDGKNMEAKVTGNQGGSYSGAISGGMGRYLNLMKDTDPKFNIVGAPWPKGPAGKPYSLHDNLIRIFVGEGAAITTTCKNQKEALELLDFCYSDEGYTLLNWGVEGESYVKENGKLKMTEVVTKNPNGLPLDQAMIRYAFPSSAAPAVCDHEARIYTNLALPQQKEASKIWAECDTGLLMPFISPTAEESNTFASVMNEINTYESEMFVKFIMGQVGMDQYEKYVQNIKSMGIEKAIQIQQAAMDRYNARK